MVTVLRMLVSWNDNSPQAAREDVVNELRWLTEMIEHVLELQRNNHRPRNVWTASFFLNVHRLYM